MKKINLIIITFLLVTTNLFADFIATVTASKGDVNILRNNQKMVASVGFKLQEKDNIITSSNAKVQIIFKDETIITIGKNSNFSIKEYLFEEDNEPVARFGMIGGAMRAITGKIGKIAPQKFSVTTKTATIGIRGTNFSINVNDNGSFEAYCTYGEINVKVNSVDYSVKQGFFLAIGMDGKIEIQEFSAKDLKEMREKKFGKVKYKNSKTSKSTQGLSDNAGNNKQLNVTINDKTEVIIQDVTEDGTDTIQNSPTLSSTIADYSMKNALYYGNYATVTNSSSLEAQGDVKLSINFAHDAAKLEIGSFANPEPTVSYNFENVNTNRVEGFQVNGDGSANILFFGPTGNIVNGNFIYNESADKSATGEYSAKTFETLH